jgi:hypothetical protein
MDHEESYGIVRLLGNYGVMQYLINVILEIYASLDDVSALCFTFPRNTTTNNTGSSLFHRLIIYLGEQSFD